jgi:tetratricopeptide (TPR) repeat protein
MMENKFFTFIRPVLSLFDNGKFFKKPFGWFYAFFAVCSFLGAFYLLFIAFQLNNAYMNRENQSGEFKGILAPRFEKISSIYDTVSQKVANFQLEMGNAQEYLNQAINQVNYFQAYSSYGESYQMDYNNAVQNRKQWESNFQEATENWKNANIALEKIKPRYEKALAEYQKASQIYDAACQKYETVNVFGDAFHGDIPKGQAIVALVLYCLIVLFIGWFNFQLWWNRMFKIDETSKEDDEFTAVPVAAHFIQTFGESLGFLIAAFGFLTALLMNAFNVCFGQFGLALIEKGILGFILPIVAGFVLIFVFRIMAETLKALAIVANNTRVK